MAGVGTRDEAGGSVGLAASARWLGWLAMMTLAGTAVVAQAGGLTAVEGVRVGHHTLAERPTGCTVVLVEKGATASVEVRGAAPATRETDLLDPVNTVQQVHAVVLSGGSAFGLDTASGVMRYLEQKGVGFDVGVAKVPIVPAAALFDLSVGDDAGVRPGAECGYLAAQAASAAAPLEGSVGAGAGATVGKLRGAGRAMKGGIGNFALRSGELVVAAMVAVNAVGEVVDPETGRLIAGVRSEDGSSLPSQRLRLTGDLESPIQSGRNTSIGVVATNARLTKTQAKRVAQVAHDGMARAIRPAHTPADGDALFVVATDAVEGFDLLLIGEMAAEAVAGAIVRAVTEATGVPGYPAASDLAPEGEPPSP
jgi:L-aminopeptidase/D-esterase-like protein